MDEEFNAFFNELANSECDMTAAEYVDFNVKICCFLPAINSSMVDWRVSSVKACLTKYLRKEFIDLNGLVSDNDDNKDDDDGASSKDAEVVEIGTGEALTMLDWLVNVKDLSKEERNSLVIMKNKLKKKRVLKKK